MTIFSIFNELLATQNLKVARIARNLECDFFCDFQTLCIRIFYRVYIFVFLGTVSLRSTVEIGMRRSFVVSPECQHQCAILGLSPIDQSVKLERPKGGWVAFTANLFLARKTGWLKKGIFAPKRTRWNLVNDFDLNWFLFWQSK